jgi:hypothetical protein
MKTPRIPRIKRVPASHVQNHDEIAPEEVALMAAASGIADPVADQLGGIISAAAVCNAHLLG